MKNNFIRLFGGFPAAIFAVGAASLPASWAEASRETQDMYDIAVRCSVHMSYLAFVAEETKNEKLEAAFQAATTRHVKDAVISGDKLGKSADEVEREINGRGETFANTQIKTPMDEKEIEAVTTACGPEILPLLK